MTNEMKALVKARPEAGLEMMHVPVPEIGANDVLVRVKKSAICGTDVHIWKWDEWAARTIPTPMVVGHEFCGEIVDRGSAAHKFETGTRVSAEGHIICGTCRNCRAGRGHLCRNSKGVGVNRAGAFAEYVALPEANIVPIPDDIPDEIAAIFDPLGNAVHTALSFDLVGEDVLVTGAGSIGIMGALVAQHVGARKTVLTDINPYRLELAKTAGVQITVNTAEARLRDVMGHIGMQEGFDVGLEMSGAAPALRQMLARMNNGGKIALLGIPPSEFSVDWNEIIFKMLIVKGIYGREIFETWYKMIAMVQGGLDVQPIITHRLSADDFAQGFDAMIKGEAGKVVLDWA